jgi:hypothetical protein
VVRLSSVGDTGEKEEQEAQPQRKQTNLPQCDERRARLMKMKKHDFDITYEELHANRESFFILSLSSGERSIVTINAEYRFNRHGQLLWVNGR